MGRMKKYKCPNCKTTNYVICYGYRKKVIRLFYKYCQRYFSFNPCFTDNKVLLNDHLDGLSFRKIARKYRISKSLAWKICHQELRKLPNNNQFTFNFCNRFSHVFLFDGKYFKENIRRNLKIRSDNTYKLFMKRIESVLRNKISDQNLNHWLWCLYRDYQQDPVCLSVLTNIEKYKQELTAYRNIHQAPITTNLIEGLNGHFESRFFALRSFQTIKHTKLWINGYVLKRRLTKYTDCRGRFRRLNGKTGVEMTKKPGIDIPILF